jgi:hypothetical protein
VTTWAVRNEQDLEMAIRAIRSRKMPFSVAITKGAPRSIEQNKLQRMWMLQAEMQGDQTAEEYRGYCKLHFGIPILLAENDKFAEVYNRLIRPLDYEEKLELMVVPIDLPITRIMTTKQKSAYLDSIYKHFNMQGIELTQPRAGGS